MPTAATFSYPCCFNAAMHPAIGLDWEAIPPGKPANHASFLAALLGHERGSARVGECQHSRGRKELFGRDVALAEIGHDHPEPAGREEIAAC